MRRVAPYDVEERLLPFLKPRLTPAEWLAVAGAAAEAHARGPRGRFATAWRQLYVGGCPVDRIWPTLWHAFKDPLSDVQDLAWLPEADALDNVRRYVALGFPTRHAIDSYGPGLGCEALVRNTVDGVARLLTLRGPMLSALASINRCRDAFTPTLCAALDIMAGIRPEEIDARPSKAALETLRSKLRGGATLSDEDRRIAPWLQAEPNRVDRLDPPVERIEAVVAKWCEAVEERVATGLMVVDRGIDRYRGSEEPARPVRIRTRKRSAPPVQVSPDLDGILVQWQHSEAEGYFWGTATPSSLDETDPLRWLFEVAEMAGFAGFDAQTGSVIVRPVRA